MRPKQCLQRARAQKAYGPLLVLMERVVERAQRRRRPHVQIGRRDVVPVRGEVDAGIVAVIQLVTELVAKRPDLAPETTPVEVRDPEIDVPRMAVVIVRMQRHPIGQEEQLGRDRVHPLVLVEPEHREPELAPRRDREHAARLRAQPLERRRAQRMLRRQAEEAQRHVAERGHEHVGPALAVHAPAALGRARHLVLLEDARPRVLGDGVQPPDDPLHHHPLRQQHRVPHHLGFPVPGRVLELGEEPVRLGERADRRRAGLARARRGDHGCSAAVALISRSPS